MIIKWKMENKLLNSKKGFNDMSLLYTILTVFILLGSFIPFVNSAFNETSTEYDVDKLTGDVGQDKVITSISAITIIGSIAQMFYWHTDLFFVFNILLLPIRITFFVLLARNIWVGGGS